jgi:secreted trypsin-like serine protease
MNSPKKLQIAILTSILMAALMIPGRASAVTDGEPDGNRHPYVGLMVAQDASGKPLWRCSGTLLSTTVFLTAGHCTESPAAHAEIWFDADVQSGVPANGYPNHGQAGGKTFTHPEFNSSAFYLRDVGIVVLSKPYKIGQFGALPTLNQLDALATQRGQQDVTFTAVGYGLQQSFPDAASWQEHNVKVRMLARPHLLQINTGFTGDQSLLLSNNANTGGTCFGDSGGPNFLGDSNIVAGVTSFGINGNCAGTGGVFRMDRSWSLNWVSGFLTK